MAVKKEELEMVYKEEKTKAEKEQNEKKEFNAKMIKRCEKLSFLEERGKIPPPKRYWKHRCPICGTIIKREKIPGPGGYDHTDYWECRCGYEYARIHLANMDY